MEKSSLLILTACLLVSAARPASADCEAHGVWHQDEYCSGGGRDVPYVRPIPRGPAPEQLQKQREEKDLHDAALDANDEGVEAYQRGDYREAVEHLTEALEYTPDDESVKRNLRNAQDALRRQQRAAEIAAQEESKRREEEAARARKYAAVLPTPPLPRVAKIRILNGQKVGLSEAANRFIDYVNEKTSSLPRPTREAVRRSIFRYVLDHAVHSLPEYATVYWTTTMGTANDINAVFEAIIHDLASDHLPGSRTQEATDTALQNAEQRMSIDKVKEAVEERLADLAKGESRQQ